MNKTQTLRQYFRDYLDEQRYKPHYSKSVYRHFIRAHYKTLDKYLSQFNTVHKFATGHIYKNRPLNIRDIYNYFKRNQKRVINQFVNYLKQKTHFSYDLYTTPKPLKIKKLPSKRRCFKVWKCRTLRKAYSEKIGEFVILILAEYIILHNLMWVAKIRPKSLHSIDKFMEPINL